MVEFYTWAEAPRLLVTLLLALTVLAQALAMVVSFHRHAGGYGQFFENALESFALAQILVCSLLYGQIVHNHYHGLVAPTGYGALRMACFAGVAGAAALAMAATRTPWPLLAVLASALTLPVMEDVFGPTFAYLYLAALLIYLARGVRICILRYGEIKTSISALSIKHAIDTLHTGVLFSEPDGFILLANAQIQRLMKTIFGRIHRNGNHFYEWLTRGDTQLHCQRVEFEGNIVYLLPDQTAWIFTRTALLIKGKVYMQLTATDITQRWVLTEQLRRQEAELIAKGEELTRAIRNLHMLSHERQTQRAKMRAHDVLGQRLSLLLRTIRSEQALDYGLLRSLSQGLLEDLKADRIAPSPQEELDGLQQAFGSIGVHVELTGSLPRDHTRGRMFTGIIRESVTNAVRHGFATKIRVQMDLLAGGDQLQITNNGYPPPLPIVEGGGIGGMRKMAESCGGELDVKTHPHFVLTVHVPGGEAHV